MRKEKPRWWKGPVKPPESWEEVRKRVGDGHDPRQWKQGTRVRRDGIQEAEVLDEGTFVHTSYSSLWYFSMRLSDGTVTQWYPSVLDEVI